MTLARMTAAAIDQVGRFFEAEPTRQGLLARRALGRPAPGDAALAERLRHHMASELRPDGTMAGGTVPTIWRVHELLDLDVHEDATAVARPVGWLLGLQDRPGSFHDGCDRARHDRQLCQHFLAGFFAPAPPGQRLAPVTLPTGKVFRVEPAARFAISCFALRAVLRAGQGHVPAVKRHLQSLASVSGQWTEWNGYFAPDTIVAGLHALAVAGGEYQDVISRLVGLVTSNQGVEGGWRRADLFHVLDALLAAQTLDAQVTVRRAATALAAAQRSDGTFGTMTQQERALIGLRALLWAARSPA